MRTSVKYMVIYRHKDKYSISEMCRFFKVSRSGYYDYVKRMDIPAWDLPLAEKIRECQEQCGKTYGYRRVHTETVLFSHFLFRSRNKTKKAFLTAMRKSLRTPNAAVIIIL